jgi:hypothetical protein
VGGEPSSHPVGVVVLSCGSTARSSFISRCCSVNLIPYTSMQVVDSARAKDMYIMNIGKETMRNPWIMEKPVVRSINLL